ncbi:hypothetical protein D3C73_1209780 [compost metagenome]
MPALEAFQFVRVETGEQIGCNAQHNCILQFDPNAATIALNLAHTTAEHGKTRHADLIRFQNRRAKPNTEPSLARTAFRRLLAVDKINIWGNRHQKSEAFGEHFCFKIGAIGTEDMGQGTAVTVFAFFTG